MMVSPNPFQALLEQYKNTFIEDIKLSFNETKILLSDFVKSLPVLPSTGDYRDERRCSICQKFYYHKNTVYLMIGNRLSLVVCRNCIENFDVTKVARPSELGELYIWHPHSDVPHTWKDKLRVYVDKEFKLWVVLNFNPSSRQEKI